MKRNKITLSEAAKSVLVKGKNFTISPKTIPTEEIIAYVEGSLRQLNPPEAEEVRQDVCKILRKAKIPKSNISKEERAALRELRAMKEIKIVPVYKGNSTVIMDTMEYENKLRSLLTSDTRYCHEIQHQ
ncbi:uncharacterized protein LOC108743758 [Agrilus planipennis]|uniref:Uncharacterized protein LOC108743758 n=1 Tax=Agrilus planipennis TaxID=224129 RepID=A0A1W4XR18_AGRPL|nr:uncharacterized protein LOC108743758 [Agrilus planipennis]